MEYRIELYRAGIRRQWRWRMRHKNGQVVATGGESYANKTDLIDTLVGIEDGFKNKDFEIVEKVKGGAVHELPADPEST